MNTEVINDLHRRAVSLGYKKGVNEYIQLLKTNSQVLEDNFKYAQDNGYKKSISDFQNLIGISDVSAPVKKKEETAPAATPKDTESKSDTGFLEQPGLNPFGIGKKVRSDFETTLKAVELGVTPLELKNAKKAEIPVEEVSEMGDMERAALSTEPVRYKPKTFEEKTKEFTVDEDKYSANKESIDNIVLPPEALDYLDKNKTVVGSRGLGQSIPIKNTELEKKLKAWYALNPEGQKEYEFHQKVLNHGRDVIDKAEEIVNQKIIEATDEWRASMVQEAQYDPTGKDVYKEKPTRLLVLEAEAEKIKNARKTLDAYKDAKTASTATQIWNQIGRQIGDVATDAASFGLIPLSKDLTYFNLKKKQEEGKALTDDEKRLLDTAAYAEYITRTYAGTNTFAQDAVTAIGHSIPYMVSFATLGGGLAKMATKTTTGALKASVQLAARQGLPNAMARVTGAQASTALQVASKLSGAIGTRGAAVLTDAIDNVAKAGIQVMIDPRTYDKTIKNMTGDVGFNVTDDGKVTFTGFENDLSFPQALTKAYTSQMVENLSEYSGGLLGTATRPLSRWTSKKIPALSRMVNKTKFTGTTKKFMDAAGFHGIVPEFFEEQLATIGHAIAGDGEGDWSDLTDPRQQLLTLVTVAAIGSGASMASSMTRKIGKDTAEMAFNESVNELKSQFGDDFVELGKSMTTNSVVVNEASIREILDNPGYSNKQKTAALNYYIAGNRYYAYKENADERAMAKTEEEQLEERKNEQIIENVLTANKGMGYEQAIEIANAEIDLRSLASNDTESGNIAKQNIKQFIQDAIQKSKTEGGLLRYEQSEMGLPEVGERIEEQKPVEAETKTEEVATAVEQLNKRRDEEIAALEEMDLTDTVTHELLTPEDREGVSKALLKRSELIRQIGEMRAEYGENMPDDVAEKLNQLEAQAEETNNAFVSAVKEKIATRIKEKYDAQINGIESAEPVSSEGTTQATPETTPATTETTPATEEVAPTAEITPPAPKERVARRKKPAEIKFDIPEVRQEVMQSLKLTLPDVDVVMDGDLEAAQKAVRDNLISRGATPEEADSAVSGMTADSGRIFNVKGKPAIIFMNPALMNDRTLGHEFWHGILTEAFGENQPLFEKFQKAIDKRLRDSGYTTIADKLTAFAEGYEAGQLDFEEYLAEFGGYLTQEGFNVDKLKGREKTLLSQIKQVINKFSKAIFGQEVFMNDATAENILEFMIAASEKMKAGEAVPTRRKSDKEDGTDQSTTTRRQAFNGIFTGVNDLLDAFSDNDIIKASGITSIKAQRANEFMSLADKTKLYKKAFGETAARAIRDNMPVAFDMQDELIPFLKKIIPIKSHTAFIAKKYGSSIERKFLTKVSAENSLSAKKAIKSPVDILKSVGYAFEYAATGEDVMGFRGYYPERGRNGVDVICTFNDPSGRAKNNYVVFIVKHDANTTVRADELTNKNINDSWREYLKSKGRENEDGTYDLSGIGNNREDPFSTSVLSIQIPKKGGFPKIISRYNHTITEGSSNPDATFGSDLNKISEGLKDSFEDFFGITIGSEELMGMPDGLVFDSSGRIFHYDKEEDGIYYGPDFYIEHGESKILDTGKERIVDGYLIRQSGRIEEVAESPNTSIVGLFAASAALAGSKEISISFLQDGDISLGYENSTMVIHTTGTALDRIKSIDKQLRYKLLSMVSDSFEVNPINGNITIGSIHNGSYDVFELLYDTDIVEIDGPFTLYGSGKFNPFRSIVSVNGNLTIMASSIQSLSKLKFVGGTLDMRGVPSLESLGDLMYVEGHIQITSFAHEQNKPIEANNLQYVNLSVRQDLYGGSAGYNRISSVNNLVFVGSSLEMSGGNLALIKEIPSLRYAGSSISISRRYDESPTFDKSESPSVVAKSIAPSIEYVGGRIVVDGVSFKKPSFDVEEGRLNRELWEDATKKVKEAVKKAVTVKSQKAQQSVSGYEMTPGYLELNKKIGDMIAQSPYYQQEGEKGSKTKKLEKHYELMLDMLNLDKAYAAMTDTQREELVINMRKELGLKVTPSPSTMIPKLLGHIENVSSITMDELELLKLKLKSEIHGVVNYKDAVYKAGVQLGKEIKELASNNRITQKQAVKILNRFRRTNLLDEVSIEKFLDYITKVFSDSNYAEFLDKMNSKRSTAISNLRDKVGNATAFIELATNVLSLKPEIITRRALASYVKILNILGSNNSVLPLDAREQMMKDMLYIMKEVEDAYNAALDLAIRFEEFEDKVYSEKTGDVIFGQTIKKMLAPQVDADGNVTPGVIDNSEYEIMERFRATILAEYYNAGKTSEEYQRATQEQKDEADKKRKEQEEKTRKRLIYTIIKSDVDESELVNKESRRSAKELIDLIKKRAYLERMSTTDLKILSAVLSNIEDGFYPHSAQKMKERLKAIGKAIDAVNAFENIKMGKLSGIRARVRSKFTKNESAYYHLIVSNPMGIIDEALGNFKGREVYNTFIRDIASAYSVYKSEYDDIQTMLDRSLDALAKENNGQINKMVARQFLMMSYALQREYENNVGNSQVVSPFATIEETIKAAIGDVSYYGAREAEILQDILTKFGETNNVTLNADAIYDSMTPVEKDMVDNILPKINASLAPKASYTAGVLRDNAIGLLNNYIHHTVLGVGKRANQATIENQALSEVNKFMNSMNVSTRSKLLTERDGKVHPIMFNIYAAASASAKSVLLDYHMTEPARVMNRTTHNVLKEMRLRENESHKRQKEGANPETEQAVRDKIKQVREIMGAVDTAVEQTLRNTVISALGHETNFERALNEVVKQGVRSMLGSIRRSLMQELGSNMLYLATYADVSKEAMSEHVRDYVYAHTGRYVMENLNAANTQRLYPSGTISGSAIEQTQIGRYYGMKQGRTVNPIVNALLTIHNNSTKKIKNFAETTADVLISTPDKFLSRQIWFGSLGIEFKRLSGEKINLDKIAENNEEYMSLHAEHLQAAKNYADLQSIRASATDNPFLGIIKTTIEPASKNWAMTFIKTFDKFLIRFQIFEFTAARAGVMSAMGNGMLSRGEGLRLLSAVMLRSMGYTTLGILTKQMMTNLIVSMYGLKGDDDESDKSVGQALTQGFATAFTSFIFGRNLGNMWRGSVNYPIELLNQKYFSGITRGDREYDMFKDPITYSFIPAGDLRGKDAAWETAKSMTGGFSPLVKTISYSANKAIYVFSGRSKDREAYERAVKDLYIRTPLEVLGLMGYVPMYNDIRKATLDILYDDLKGRDKGPYKSEAEKAYLKSIGK